MILIQLFSLKGTPFFFAKLASALQANDVQAWIEAGDTIEFLRNGSVRQTAFVTYISPEGRIDYEYETLSGKERWYTEAHKVIGLRKATGAAYGSFVQSVAV
ncbi:MAG: hypothetical protein SF123_10940 [Chloroflexota bacterium]|nr:hypothetical protein [Chloroflexota bacterium]